MLRMTVTRARSAFLSNSCSVIARRIGNVDKMRAKQESENSFLDDSRLSEFDRGTVGRECNGRRHDVAEWLCASPSRYGVPGGAERSLTQKALPTGNVFTWKWLPHPEAGCAATRPRSETEIVEHQPARLFPGARMFGAVDALRFWTRDLHRPIGLAALAFRAGDADARALVHQQVAAVAIRTDPLVQRLREGGVDGEVFGGSFGIKIRHAVGEWPERGMIERTCRGHRLGLLLGDARKSGIDRDLAFAVLMPVARNQLGVRRGARGRRAGEGEQDDSQGAEPRRQFSILAHVARAAAVSIAAKNQEPAIWGFKMVGESSSARGLKRTSR